VTEYVRPRRKGTGGVLKAKWSDFRVQEVRARDGRPVRWVAGSANSTGGEAEYLRFVLAKAGFDTLSAVGKLSDFLQVRGRAARLARGKRSAGAGAGADLGSGQVDRGRFGFAGIKDKSAVTIQEMTVRVHRGAPTVPRPPQAPPRRAPPPAPRRARSGRPRRCRGCRGGCRGCAWAASSLSPRAKSRCARAPSAPTASWFCCPPLSAAPPPPPLREGRAPSAPRRVLAPTCTLRQVLLRRLKRSCTVRRVTRAMATVARGGFVSYYGHQRFGLAMRSSMPTVRVGKALLQTRWDEAIAEVMSPALVADTAERRAKEDFSRAWAAARGRPGRRPVMEAAGRALAALPSHCHGEAALLRGLQAGRSSQQALREMPQRQMYMLAYWSWSPPFPLPTGLTGHVSSLLSRTGAGPAPPPASPPRRAVWGVRARRSRMWNRAASERVRRYGARRVVAGDLVCLDKAMRGAGDRPMRVKARRPATAPPRDPATPSTADSARGQRRRRAGVQVVSAAEAERARRGGRGALSVRDVVLPLLGRAVQLSLPARPCPACPARPARPARPRPRLAPPRARPAHAFRPRAAPARPRAAPARRSAAGVASAGRGVRSSRVSGAGAGRGAGERGGGGDGALAGRRGDARSGARPSLSGPSASKRLPPRRGLSAGGAGDGAQHGGNAREQARDGAVPLPAPRRWPRRPRVGPHPLRARASPPGPPPPRGARRGPTALAVGESCAAPHPPRLAGAPH
jgi:tRNA(Glu) U13 pseudouridine synthase TruD